MIAASFARFIAGAALFTVVSLAGPAGAVAQESHDLGVARSLAILTALQTVCPGEVKVNVREVDETASFLKNAFPPKNARAFKAALSQEETKVRGEIEAAGAADWCNDQKSKLTRVNGGQTPKMFR